MGSFGAALRRTREQKGISLDEIAGETRLSKRYLLALEDEAIHKLPGGTYNRAYLRSYAAYLGLDIDPLVHEYSLEEAHQTETGRLKPPIDVLASLGKVVESRQPSAGARRPWDVNWNWIVDREHRTALFGGLALLTVVLLTGLIWIDLPGFRQETAIPAAGTAAARTAAPEPARPAAPSVAEQQDEAPEPPRKSAPPATSRPESASAAASPKSITAPAPAPPVVPTPAIRASKRAEAAVTPPATAAASAKARSAPATKGRLSVANSGVGVEVVGKSLVGESDTFAIGTRVTFWSRVAGGRPGDTISHVWFHNGERIGATSLRIGSTDWRTQSNQLLASDGEWAVEARDADGRVLVRHDFHAARR